MFRAHVRVVPGLDVARELRALMDQGRRRGLRDSEVKDMVASVEPLLAALSAEAKEIAAHGITVAAQRTIAGDGYDVRLWLQGRPTQGASLGTIFRRLIGR
jgi:hypothetical protein